MYHTSCKLPHCNTNFVIRTMAIGSRVEPGVSGEYCSQESIRVEFHFDDQNTSVHSILALPSRYPHERVG